MEMKWLHIDTDVGDNWVLPIWSAVNKAIESKLVPTLRRRFSQHKPGNPGKHWMPDQVRHDGIGYLVAG